MLLRQFSELKSLAERLVGQLPYMSGTTQCSESQGVERKGEYLQLRICFRCFFFPRTYLQCCGSEIILPYPDSDPTFQGISDPDPILDPTLFISKEAKPKFEIKTSTLILILKKRF